MYKHAIVAALAATGVITGLVGCAGMTRDASHPATDTTGQAIASTGAATTGVTCALVAPSPAWLPAQATMDAVSCADTSASPLAHGPSAMSALRNAPDQFVSLTPGRTVRTTHYALSGAVNASTVTPGATTGHFGTDIQLVTYVGATTMDAALQDRYTRVATVTLSSGVTARLTTMTNGYGPVRIEWVTRGNSYLLLSDHLINADGTSGVATGDLIKLAGSVPLE